MKIITIASRKGGSGKTTTVSALTAIARRSGKKTLMIDLDSQANLTYQTEAKAGFSALDVLTGKAKAGEAIQETEQGDIIPASASLATADMVITEIGKEYRLKEALQAILSRYDLIVIDTPANLGIVTVNALTASDAVLIPVGADVFSLQGIGTLSETIQTVRKYCNPDLKTAGILLTMYKPRLNISKDMKENAMDLASDIGTDLLNAFVRDCTAVKEAVAMRTDLYSYAPKCTAANDYIAVYEELEKKGVF